MASLFLRCNLDASKWAVAVCSIVDRNGHCSKGYSSVHRQPQSYFGTGGRCFSLAGVLLGALARSGIQGQQVERSQSLQKRLQVCCNDPGQEPARSYDASS